jgi:membrane protease YdiL (CAAX protease family)
VEQPNHPDTETLTRPQILVVMGVTAILLMIVAKVWQYFGNVRMLPLQFAVEPILLGMGIAVGITVASSIMYRLWSAYRRSADFYLEMVLKPLILPDLIWLGLLPGLSEELLFRGIMLPALGLNINAVIISSLLFGILHLSGMNQWPYVIWATIIGFVLGYTALATGNLLIPIVAHILTNLVSSLLWKLGNSVGFTSS